MKFTVEWEEWVYDAFDEIESIGQRTLTLEAESLEEVAASALHAMQSVIDQERPDKSHDMFIPHLIAIVDENGHRTVYNPRHRVRGYEIVTMEETDK